MGYSSTSSFFLQLVASALFSSAAAAASSSSSGFWTFLDASFITVVFGLSWGTRTKLNRTGGNYQVRYALAACTSQIWNQFHYINCYLKREVEKESAKEWERTGGHRSDSHHWTSLARAVKYFRVESSRVESRLKLLLNCHNLWRIMSKLLTRSLRLQLDCQAKRLPIQSLSQSSSIPSPLLHVTSGRGKGGVEAAQSVSARKPRLWVAFPSLQFVCFCQPTASIMLSITQLNWQTRLPSPHPSPLSIFVCLCPAP